MSCNENLFLNRRRLLQGGACLAFSSLMPITALAGARDPRLLLVILRGGLDGISLVAPTGDPDYEKLRGELALPATGSGAGPRLDAMFCLHPSLAFVHKLYARGEALVAHAIATPYRGRSHFDGQDVLENGHGGRGQSHDGWLNRALSSLPDAGAVAIPKGLSFGAVVPLVMRGPAKVLNWSPPAYAGRPDNDSTLERLQDLYAHTDPELGRALAAGLAIDGLAGPTAANGEIGAGLMGSGETMTESMRIGKLRARLRRRGRGRNRVFVEAAARAAKFLTAPDGPRIGVLSYNGWDTHSNEGVRRGKFANRLGGLDAAIKALHDGLGPVWSDTVVVFATEFGRTARTNGTRGTDHGTASVSLLVGGAVKGGRVIADWPGLSERALFEGRDLMPTSDLRSLFKGVLRDHLGLPSNLLGTKVFPGSMPVEPMSGLIA